MTQSKLKHRILLILHKEENTQIIPFYFQTLEQAGMITYLFRRCFIHNHFEVMHDVYTRSTGYNTVGTPYEIKKTQTEVELLYNQRLNKSSHMVYITDTLDITGKSVNDLEFYLMSLTDAQILHTLISTGLCNVTNTTGIKQRKHKTSIWEDV